MFAMGRITLPSGNQDSKKSGRIFIHPCKSFYLFLLILSFSEQPSDSVDFPDAVIIFFSENLVEG